MRLGIVVGVLCALSFGVVHAAQDSVQCNTVLLANVNDYPSNPTGYQDIWGYVAPNGDEYALVTYNTGTIFYNVTDPLNPAFVSFLPGLVGSGWHDVKTLGQYAYVVSEGTGHGMQIIDLSDPEAPFVVSNWLGSGFSTAHNIYIDTTASMAYLCGSNANPGFRMVDLSNPTSPVQVGTWNTQYIHDLWVENDTAYVACINAQEFRILDTSNPASIVNLSTFNYGRSSHHIAPLPGHDFFLTADEQPNGAVRCWDVSDFQNIFQTSRYKTGGFETSAHNVHTVGSTAYIAYYGNGLRIVDFSDPDNEVELGFYDTHPQPGAGVFDGAWGVYPYLPSGTILVSDRQTGLYLIRMQSATSVADGAPISATQAHLLPNVPNPFNPTTSIRYSLPTAGAVDLTVFSQSGRLVRTLASGTETAGTHTTVWDGRDNAGRDVASGVYFYRLEFDGAVAETRKLHLIR